MLVTLRKRPSSPTSLPTSNANHLIANREQRHLMLIAATEMEESQGRGRRSAHSEELPQRKQVLAASMRPQSARAQIVRGKTADSSVGARRAMPQPPAQRRPASAREPRSWKEPSSQASKSSRAPSPRSPRIPSPRTPSRWEGVHPVLISLAATHYKRDCDNSLPASVMDMVRRRRELFP